MLTLSAASTDQYNRAVAGCGVYDQAGFARLWADGRDRLDLLHRMSTNDLNGLPPNEGRATVLTTPVARMVDRLLVINLGERALLLASRGAGEAVRRWLAGYIFFNDDVTLSDASTDLGRCVLFGPRASEVAEALLPGAAGLGPYGVMQRDSRILVRAEPLLGQSFLLLTQREQMTTTLGQAVAAGAAEVDEAVYEVARIESGLPGFGHEIGEAYIPLEAGLWDDISFSKGCYIGQEIIARMESRGKLAKTLVGLRAEAPLAEGSEFAGGIVTSVAHSPRFGWIGLGFVKPSEAEPGRQVVAGGVSLQVAALPFRG